MSNVTITIGGRDYTVACDSGEEAHVAALGRLMGLTLRVDPLLTELSQLSLKAESTAIRISVVDALGTVLLMGGNKATPACLESTKVALLKALFDEEETVRASAARSFARLAWFLEPAAVMDAALDLLDTGKSGAGAASASAAASASGVGADHASQVCGRLLGLGAVLQGAGQQVADVRDEAFTALLAGCRDDRAPVNSAAVR